MIRCGADGRCAASFINWLFILFLFIFWGGSWWWWSVVVVVLVATLIALYKYINIEAACCGTVYFASDKWHYYSHYFFFFFRGRRCHTATTATMAAAAAVATTAMYTIIACVVCVMFVLIEAGSLTNSGLFSRVFAAISAATFSALLKYFASSHLFHGWWCRRAAELCYVRLSTRAQINGSSEMLCFTYCIVSHEVRVVYVRWDGIAHPPPNHRSVNCRCLYYNIIWCGVGGRGPGRV